MSYGRGPRFLPGVLAPAGVGAGATALPTEPLPDVRYGAQGYT